MRMPKLTMSKLTASMMMIFNSKLKLFPNNLKLKWLGSFQVRQVFSYEAIEVWIEVTGSFKVHGPRLKHYNVEKSNKKRELIPFPNLFFFH